MKRHDGAWLRWAPVWQMPGNRALHFMTVNERRCFTDLSHMTGGKALGLTAPMGEVNPIRHHVDFKMQKRTPKLSADWY